MMDLERSETWSDFKQIGPNHNFSPQAHSPPPKNMNNTNNIRPSGSSNILDGLTNQDVENDLYRTLNDDGEVLDEETINWPVLLTRVFALFLLFLVILFCSLEEVSRKFLWLAAIICVVLLVVIVCTFVDLRPYFCFCCPAWVTQTNYFVSHWSTAHQRSNKNNTATSSNNNSANSSARPTAVVRESLMSNENILKYSGSASQRNPMITPISSKNNNNSSSNNNHNNTNSNKNSTNYSSRGDDRTFSSDSVQTNDSLR